MESTEGFPHFRLTHTPSVAGAGGVFYCAGYEDGAEGGTRTPMGLLPLDPEPSVSANSTTSALAKDRQGCYMRKAFSLIYQMHRFVNGKKWAIHDAGYRMHDEQMQGKRCRQVLHPKHEIRDKFK